MTSYSSIDRKVKMKSPVDTGRFRMNWQITENITTDSTIDATCAKGFIPRANKLNYQKEKAGKTYYVQNNLPYSERLANGWSDQAPDGWIELIAKQETRRVQRNWNNIVRRKG
jgi:hypothetical protein